MRMKPLNARIVTAKLKRIELCDLMIACTIVGESANAEKWSHLHDHLKQILDEFDKDHKED